LDVQSHCLLENATLPSRFCKLEKSFNLHTPPVTDSTQAVRDFAASSDCHWELDVQSLQVPVSAQKFPLPDVCSLARSICVPWGSSCLLAQSLSCVPDLHEVTCVALQMVPSASPLQTFAKFHIFTDGSFFPPGVDPEGEPTLPLSAWAFVVIAGDYRGAFFFLGGVGGPITVAPDRAADQDPFFGISRHSSLYAEYIADAYALMWVFQCPDQVSFSLNGDCMCPSMPLLECRLGVQSRCRISLPLSARPFPCSSLCHLIT
jgi:hypothetical protein